jgi:hypothetical protein
MESNSTKPWFRDDIIRILIGINLSSRASMNLDQDSAIFRRGFSVAIASMAIAIGISPEQILHSDDLIPFKQQPWIEKGE